MRKIKNLKDSIIKVLYPNILFKDGSINKKDVYKNIIHQVRERNLICAIFIFFIQLFFFIKYINEGFYIIDAVHKYHMVAQIIFASSSVIAVVYYMLTIKKDFDVLNRIANIVYSFIILFAMFLWMVCSITHDPDAFSIAFIDLK